MEVNNFIVAFNDLTDKKQDEIVRAVVRYILEEKPTLEREEVEKVVIKACAGTSYSWQIEVSL